jgi:hypothetical protein
MLDLILEPGGPHRTIFGAADALIGDLSRRAGRIRCEEHHRAVELEVLSRDGDDAEVRVRGCCDDIIERAGRMLL